MKKNRKRKFVIYFFLTLPIIIFVGLGFATRLSFLRIKDITILDAKAIDTSDVKKYIQDNLSGKYLFLYQKNNIFLFPKTKIEENFTNVFPRSYGLQIKLNKKLNLEASVFERSPFMLWCGKSEASYVAWDGNNEDKLKEKCYMADKTGYIFSESPEYSGVVYPKIYIAIDNLNADEPPIAKHILPRDKFQNLSLYIDFLTKNKINISSVLNPEGDYYNLMSSSADSKNNFLIKINIKNDANEIKKNFENALVNSSLKKISEVNYKDIQYLDLRFVEKIFYK